MRAATKAYWCRGLIFIALWSLLGVTWSQNIQSTPPAETAPPAESTLDVPNPLDDAQSLRSDDDSWAQDHRSHRHRHHSWVDGGEESVVSIGHDSTLGEGEQADTVVSIFGSSTSAGAVRESVVAVFGSARVTGPVADSVVTVIGNSYIDSHVRGDVVTVLGNVELGPAAEIDGDLVAIGGVLRRHPDAVIHGNVSRIVSFDLVRRLGWAQEWIERCLLYGRPLAFGPGLGWAWTVALGFLALYAFLALLFRDAVERCVWTLENHPGRSMLVALLTILLTPLAFALLFVTVIGIAVLPFLAVGLFITAMFGKVALLASFGRRCTPFFSSNPALHTVIGVIIAGLLLLLLYTVPIVGFIVYKVLGTMGLGLGIYTLILAADAERSARRSAAPPTAAPPAGTAAPLSSASTQSHTPDPSASGGSASFASVPGASMSGASTPDASFAGAPPASAASPAAPHLYSAAPRAGFWIRMGALLLDCILVGIVLQLMHNPVNVEVVALAAYGAVMWKLKGSTVGGIICGLRVVRIDGRDLDWTTVIVRALGCFLSLAVAGLGFIWIGFDPEKQSWHDKLAGTIVVRSPTGASLL